MLASKLKYIFLLVPILCFAGWGLSISRNSGDLPETAASSLVSHESYETSLGRIESQRIALASRYKKAETAKKSNILAEAGVVFGKFLANDLIPHWYGTPWDFNGTSKVPGEGQIACGYFVTTLLEDAGVILPRVKMAQQASSIIMKSLDNGRKPTWYSNISAADFATKMGQQPSGLYLLGLDYHTGFIYVEGGTAWFLHANYLQPQEVLKEKVALSPAIAASNVKVVGRISTSEWLIQRWLNQENVPVL